jgi:hypothetical protein
LVRANEQASTKVEPYQEIKQWALVESKFNKVCLTLGLRVQSPLSLATAMADSKPACRSNSSIPPSIFMATQEIYIRNATETEARGPFTAQQVADLAEAGQVSAETLVYDANSEQWVALNTNPELMSIVFPERRRLSLKSKEISTLNKAVEESRPITVSDMLAAAEGHTDDTRGKSDPQVSMARAARIGMYGALISLVAAAAAEILPHTDTLVAMTPEKLLAHPFVLLGVIDIVLAVLLALGMVTLYPFFRFRAALGLGLMGFIFFAQGQSTPFLAVVVGSIGLYLCTVVVSLIPAIVAFVAAVGGMGMLAYHFIFQ